MPINSDFTNETAAAVTSCDGLDFVLTTLPLTPWKDGDHGVVHLQSDFV